MSELPRANWTRMRIRDLIERHFSGPSPTCEERQVSSADEWGLLKTTAVTWDGWNQSAHKVPPKEYWGRSSIEVHAGDVLVTKAGPRHRVGVVVCVDETRPKLMVSGKMIGLRPRRSVVFPQVLAGLLGTESMQQYLDSRTTGMAESQTNFADEALLDGEVAVPPLPQQRAIAEVLDAADRQVRSSQLLIAKLAGLKRSLVTRLLESGIEEAGRLREPLASPELFVETQLGLLPRGWDVDSLGSWLDGNPKNGYSPVPVDRWTGTSMLGLGCLSADGFAPSQLKNAPLGDPSVSRTLLTDGDLLMSRANTRDLVGFAGIYRDIGHACSYPDLMMRLTPRRGLSREFLAMALNSASVRMQVKNLASGTSGSMVKISGQIVKSLVVAVPPLLEQERICSRLSLIQRAIDEANAQMTKSMHIRQGLRADLLAGVVGTGGVVL